MEGMSDSNGSVVAYLILGGRTFILHCRHQTNGFDRVTIVIKTAGVVAALGWVSSTTQVLGWGDQRRLNLPVDGQENRRVVLCHLAR